MRISPICYDPIMKLHEYQARELLAAAGVPVPDALVIDAPDQAAHAFAKLGAARAVVKAQVHAGGRGKGGGVKLVASADEARDAAAAMLSRPLVTPQTGPAGVPVHKLLVAAGVNIASEFYLSIVLDRGAAAPVLIASAQGGMDIETVAADNPQAILKHTLHPLMPVQPYQARQVAYRLGFAGTLAKQAAKIITALDRVLRTHEAMLVEINPLIVTAPTDDAPDGELLAIDAKISIDDNALMRHDDLAALDDPSQLPPAEVEARQHDLSYVKLDGTIGCLVNGAGLAMATMDIIKHHGGEPANFLDVGGGADVQRITRAFRILLADENVRGVLVNIFGGIMRCDAIATAIARVAKEVGFAVPLIVRLEGTNVDAGRAILERARGDLPTLRVAGDLADAAEQIVAAVA
jgi:succinyl-CoA synthetase beta subunit